MARAAPRRCIARRERKGRPPWRDGGGGGDGRARRFKGATRKGGWQAGRRREAPALRPQSGPRQAIPLLLALAAADGGKGNEKGVRCGEPAGSGWRFPKGGKAEQARAREGPRTAGRLGRGGRPRGIRRSEKGERKAKEKEKGRPAGRGGGDR